MTQFTIVSINDDRAAYKDKIRRNVPFEEVELPAVNGHTVDLSEEFRKRDLRITGWEPSAGEAGVWLSMFDRWTYAAQLDEPLIVFEDDAVVGTQFADKFYLYTNQMPREWDFSALWVPGNQTQDYCYNVTGYADNGKPYVDGFREYRDSLFKYSRRVAHVYQGYGMVAVMYAPIGAEKLVQLAREKGAHMPVDCFLYHEAHVGPLDGYAPTPLFPMVSYDWSAPTTVHDIEKVKF